MLRQKLFIDESNVEIKYRLNKLSIFLPTNQLSSQVEFYTKIETLEVCLTNLYYR